MMRYSFAAFGAKLNRLRIILNMSVVRPDAWLTLMTVDLSRLTQCKKALSAHLQPNLSPLVLVPIVTQYLAELFAQPKAPPSTPRSPSRRIRSCGRRRRGAVLDRRGICRGLRLR